LYYTSAKNNEGVDECFAEVAKLLYQTRGRKKDYSVSLKLA